MTVPDATPEDRPHTVVVLSFGLTDHDIEELFDRVAEAAHFKDEQLFCFGGGDLVVMRADELAQRDARIKAEAWDEGFIGRLGDTPRYKSRAEWGNPYREAQP